MTKGYVNGRGIVIQIVPDTLQPLVDGFLTAIPLIVGALIILLLGWIVGRILGRIVRGLVERIRPSEYAADTPLEREGEPDEDIARSLGDLTKYIVYFLAILVTLDYIGISLPGEFLTTIANGAVVFIVAIAIFIAGIAIGRVVGDIVESIVGGLGLDRYTRDTPFADATDTDGRIDHAAGKIVEYLIYLFALLIALDYAGIGIPGAFLTNIAGGVVQIVVAAIILIVGVAIGRVVGDFTETVVDGFDFDSTVRNTPLANVTRAVGGVGSAVGKIVEYLIYFFALVAAVDVLGFPALSEPLTDFIGQIPLLIGAVIVLLVGLYIADLLGDIVANFDRSRATDLIGLGIQVFVSYVVIVFALDTAGFDTTVLTNLFNAVIVAFFGALGLGLAIAIGVGVGWGSKEYVAENIDDWMSRARRRASDYGERRGGRGDATTRDDSTAFDDESPSDTGR